MNDALLGVIGGVTAGGAVSLLTAIVNHRWQEQSARRSRNYAWRQEQAPVRRDTYVRYLAAAQSRADLALTFGPSDSSMSRRELFHEMRKQEPGRVEQYDIALSLDPPRFLAVSSGAEGRMTS